MIKLLLLQLCMVYVIFLWNEDYISHIKNIIWLRLHNLLKSMKFCRKTIFYSCLTGYLGAVTLQLMFTVSVSAVGKSMWYRINVILNSKKVLLFYINLCVNLSNVFTKHKFKLKKFKAVRWSYGKWCLSIVRSIGPLVDHFFVKF